MLLSLSPSLPLLSRHSYSVFRSAKPYFRAQYVLAATMTTVPNQQQRQSWALIISSWLRFGVCDLEVFKVLEKIHKPHPACLATITVTGIELPKRLFRDLITVQDAAGQAGEGCKGVCSDDSSLLHFLQYLFTPRMLVYSGTTRRLRFPEDYGSPENCHKEAIEVETPFRCLVTLGPADPNSNEGYALTKAVYAQQPSIITLLLDSGANPTCKGNLAMKIALSKSRSLNAKLETLTQWRTLLPLSGQKNPALAKVLLERVKPANLQKGQELLTLALKCDARDVIEMLKERGVVPNMKTVQLLMKSR